MLNSVFCVELTAFVCVAVEHSYTVRESERKIGKLRLPAISAATTSANMLTTEPQAHRTLPLNDQSATTQLQCCCFAGVHNVGTSMV